VTLVQRTVGFAEIGELDMLGSEVIKTGIECPAGLQTHCATTVERLTGVSEQIAEMVSLPPRGGVVKSHAFALLGLLMYSARGMTSVLSPMVKKRKTLNAGRWRAVGSSVTADAKTLVGGVGARRTVDGALWWYGLWKAPQEHQNTACCGTFGVNHAVVPVIKG
jgi:hypothetical protein